jgi:hypothetical protein
MHVKNNLLSGYCIHQSERKMTPVSGPFPVQVRMAILQADISGQPRRSGAIRSQEQEWRSAPVQV